MSTITSAKPVCKEPKELISHSELKRLLHYDPETGIWTRRTTFGSAYRAGDRADVPRVKGYLRVTVKKVAYAAHRLANFYMTGVWPASGLTDHENNIRHDNRWSNLRIASASQNRANSKISVRNTSGWKGVHWCKRRRKWRVRLVYRKKSRDLGYFDCPAAAHFAYIVYADKTFGEFARAR